MSRELTADELLIRGLGRRLPLDQLKDLYLNPKTDKTLTFRNGKGYTAFLAAVGLCNHQFISFIFSQNPSQIPAWIHQLSPNGLTVLHILAEDGFVGDGEKTAQLLLDNYANIDAVSKGDNPVTPLHIATALRNVPFVNFFLSRGANMFYRGTGSNAQTPIELSCASLEKPSDNAVQAKMREAFLLAACKIGDAIAVAALLAAGTNINTRDQNKRTPLHHAVEGKHREVVALLLAHSTKPEIDAIDILGFTPLVIAIMARPHDDENLIAITRSLVKNRADLFFKFRIDDTEVICIELMAKACKRGVFEVIDPSIIEKYREKEKGYSLLHLAVLTNNLGTTNTQSGPIGLLKDVLGIDIRSSGSNKTSLELVTVNGTAECATVLLQFGANPLLEVAGKKGVCAYAFAKSTDNANPERAAILEAMEPYVAKILEKENLDKRTRPEPVKAAAPTNLHLRLPAAPASKPAGKTPAFFAPSKPDGSIHVSSKLRAAASSSSAAAAASLPRPVPAGVPVSGFRK